MKTLWRCPPALDRITRRRFEQIIDALVAGRPDHHAAGGRDLRATDDIYSFFEETAGKSIVLRVGPNPDGTNSREVAVVPIDDKADCVT